MSDPFVRPDVAQFLAYLNNLPGPKAWEVGPEGARKMTDAMRDVADLEVGPLAVNRAVEGAPVPMRLFDARAQREASPVLVFFHGGGWVLGSLHSYEPVCAEIARLLDLPVLSIDYRLAPEAPFPAAPEDCEAAARWIAEASRDLGISAASLVLAGDSAGGNLAAVTAIALRDRSAAVPVLAQWLIYPATDFTRPYPSLQQFGEGYFLTHEGMGWFNRCYAADAQDWRASPIVADLAGLPPALVSTASLDPIRDQGRAYAAALATAGVDVVYREAHGTVHGFINLRRAIPSAQADLQQNLAVLKTLIAGAAA